MNRAFCLTMCALPMAASLAVFSGVAVAADRFEVGDEIQVLFMTKWLPATVLNLNPQGAVLAEFEFAGGKQSGAFTPAQARLKCEVGALAPAREWKDASGEFRIRAAVMEIADDKVTLRKPNMDEIDVPVSKLSRPDRSYLARLKKDTGPRKGAPAQARPPGEIAVERFAVRKGYGSQEGTPPDATETVSLAPDPVPAYLKLEEGGAVLTNPGLRARVSAVLPVGGADGWLLAAVESHNMGRPNPTLLVWVSLARNKIEGRQLLPPGEIVLDYHSPSHRLLSRVSDDPALGMRRGEDPTRPLTVWEVVPTDSRAMPVARWVPDSEEQDSKMPGSSMLDDVSDRWMRLADANTVIQTWQTSQLVAWDIAAKRMRYRISRNTSLFHWPALGGTRKYLFVPDNERVRVLDSLTGRVLSVLPTSYYVNAVAVADDGRRVATAGGGLVTVWDLSDANATPREYQAEQLGSSLSSPMRWQNDERLWAARDSKTWTLFSLKHRAVLWSFRFSSEPGQSGRFCRVRELVRDHVAYSTAAGTSAGMGGDPLAIGAVALPGPKVEEADATFDRESLVAIRPGSTIRLVLKTDDDARVRAVLEEVIKNAGWIIDPNSPTVLTAEMGRSDHRQVSYYDRNNNLVETASVEPYFSRVTIKYEGKEVLKRSTGTGAPHSVWLKPGETVQQKVDEEEKPSFALFDYMHLPKELLHPEKRNGAGTTKVTNRGLVVGAPLAANHPIAPAKQSVAPAKQPVAPMMQRRDR